jgi:3-phosphoshikimate 1-carboxyvinyltransferase
MDFITKRSKLFGNATVSGSKSHTIRAVLLATMTDGVSYIHNPLSSLDCLSSMNVAMNFGSETKIENGLWIIKGRGKQLEIPDNYVDCANSGSTAYFAASMAGLIDGYTVLTGDAQFRRRPIRPVLEAINQLGGKAFTTRPDVDACPAIIKGKMEGGRVYYRKSLSQFVSSIMMVSPLLEADTEIFNDEPLEKPYLQITIDWMKRFGVELEKKSEDYSYFKIRGGQTYTPVNVTIPGDWSSAVFLLVAGVVVPSKITISGMDFNDSQGDKAVVDLLIKMGADIYKDKENNKITVTGGKPLFGNLTFDLSDIPDSLPALAVLAAYVKGDITYTGLAHVRLKETDRVATMTSELSKVGIKVTTGTDYMVVHGGSSITGAVVESFKDHRVAMAMAICGLFSNGEMTVKNCESVDVSFPTFYEVFHNLGAKIQKG